MKHINDGQYYNKKKEAFNNNTDIQPSVNFVNTYQIQTTVQNDNLRKIYNEKKASFQKILDNIKTKTTNFVERVSPNNKFSNHFIRFSDSGAIFYVTSRGVAKYISSTEILNSLDTSTCGKNDSSNIINMTIPWNADWYQPGQQITSEPPLITGTPMLLGESCGNEGKNIRVDTLTALPVNTEYIGCFNASGSSGNALPITAPLATIPYTYDSCLKFALEQKVPYFGLQNNGTCVVGDSSNLAIGYGNGTIITPKKIWSVNSNNSNIATSLSVLTTGQLVLMDINGLILWNSGNIVNECMNGGNIDKNSISATFGYNCNNSKSNKNKTTINMGNVTSAVQSIINNTPNNTNIYTIPIPSEEFGDPAYGCKKDFSISYKCGNVPMTQYIQKADGRNMLLDCSKTVAACNFSLKLLDSGEVVLLNTTSGIVIWSSETMGQQQQPNNLWKSTLGKMVSLNIGQSLNSGEWLGSPSGNIKLILELTGELCLYTSIITPGCTEVGTDTNKYYMGLTSDINSVYHIKTPINKNGVPNGTIAHITDDSHLIQYKPEEIHLSKNKYSINQGYDIFGNDIPNVAKSGINIEDCKTICSQIGDDCIGFSFENTTNTCYPKKVAGQQIPSTYVDTYLRQNILNTDADTNNLTEHMQTMQTMQTMPTNANTYMNYPSSTGQNTFIKVLNTVQQQQLNQTETELNLLAGQMIKSSDNAIATNNKIINQTKNNSTGIQRIIYEKTDIENNNIIANIVKDSKLIVSQYYFKYILWFFLLIIIIVIGLLFISMVSTSSKKNIFNSLNINTSTSTS
jgi:hypothetical protein